MKIAIIAPPWLPIPPKGYGGTERVLDHLIKGLLVQKHEVILYTIGTSRTKATQKWIFPEGKPLGLVPTGDPPAGLAQAIFAHKDAVHSGVDVIHDNTIEGVVIGAFSPLPVLHTVHGPLNDPSSDSLIRRLYYPIRNDVGFAAISDFQRRQMPSLNWITTAYNPIDVSEMRFKKDRGDFLLFLGRISHKKGVHLACEVAKRTGERLVVAGTVNDPTENEYFETKVRPYFSLPNIEYVGEAIGKTRIDLFADCKAFLFPIQWEEPFGMVLGEASAAGAPVVAFRNGSVEELVTDGLNGFVVDTLDQMIAALDRLGEIDPVRAREFVAANFSTEVVTERYLDAYRTVIGQKASATLKESTFFERLTDIL